MNESRQVKEFPAQDARQLHRLGAWISGLMALLTVVTLGIAVMTPPLSGPFCPEGCFTYPYLDTASRFPRDFYWMYPSMGLMLLFVAFLVVVHRTTAPAQRPWSQMALSFGQLAAGIIVVDYFIQVSVIQPSLLSGETDGVALLSQFNPHGLFIALEEIGYLLVLLALVCLAPVGWKAGRLGRAAAWTAISAFVGASLSLVAISLAYGVMREYRFEVAVICFTWIALIIVAVLFGLLYRRAAETSLSQNADSPPVSTAR